MPSPVVLAAGSQHFDGGGKGLSGETTLAHANTNTRIEAGCYAPIRLTQTPFEGER